MKNVNMKRGTGSGSAVVRRRVAEQQQEQAIDDAVGEVLGMAVEVIEAGEGGEEGGDAAEEGGNEAALWTFSRDHICDDIQIKKNKPKALLQLDRLLRILRRTRAQQFPIASYADNYALHGCNTRHETVEEFTSKFLRKLKYKWFQDVAFQYFAMLRWPADHIRAVVGNLTHFACKKEKGKQDGLKPAAKLHMPECMQNPSLKDWQLRWFQDYDGVLASERNQNGGQAGGAPAPIASGSESEVETEVESEGDNDSEEEEAAVGDDDVIEVKIEVESDVESGADCEDCMFEKWLQSKRG